MHIQSPIKVGWFQLNCGTIVDVFLQSYRDGAPALKLVTDDGEPYGSLSICLPESTSTLRTGEFFVKTFSENQSLVQPALASGLFIDTGRTVRSGYLVYPVWQIHPSVFASLKSKEVAHVG